MSDSSPEDNDTGLNQDASQGLANVAVMLMVSRLFDLMDKKVEALETQQTVFNRELSQIFIGKIQEQHVQIQEQNAQIERMQDKYDDLLMSFCDFTKELNWYRSVMKRIFKGDLGSLNSSYDRTKKWQHGYLRSTASKYSTNSKDSENSDDDEDNENSEDDEDHEKKQASEPPKPKHKFPMQRYTSTIPELVSEWYEGFNGIPIVARNQKGTQWRKNIKSFYYRRKYIIDFLNYVMKDPASPCHGTSREEAAGDLEDFRVHLKKSLVEFNEICRPGVKHQTLADFKVFYSF